MNMKSLLLTIITISSLNLTTSTKCLEMPGTGTVIGVLSGLILTKAAYDCFYGSTDSQKIADTYAQCNQIQHAVEDIQTKYTDLFDVLGQDSESFERTIAQRSTAHPFYETTMMLEADLDALTTLMEKAERMHNIIKDRREKHVVILEDATEQEIAAIAKATPKYDHALSCIEEVQEIIEQTQTALLILKERIMKHPQFGREYSEMLGNDYVEQAYCCCQHTDE